MGNPLSTHEPLPPAPWTWDVDRPENYDLTWLTDANGRRFYSNYGGGGMTPLKRLWGAAPELLEACKAAHAVLLAFEKFGLLAMPHEREALELVRAAIAKAYEAN